MQVNVGQETRPDDPASASAPAPTRLELSTFSGEVVASLTIPPDLSDQANTTLSITFVNNVPDTFSKQELGGSILEIVLTDTNGERITELDAPLVICLARPNATKKVRNSGVCLSFYDERKAKWVCEDECLSYTGKEDQLCGQTSHLTNFALLLSGASGGSGDGDPCTSSSQDNTLAWVSLGMVAGAIVIVALCVVVVEIRTRMNAGLLDQEINSRLNFATK